MNRILKFAVASAALTLFAFANAQTTAPPTTDPAGPIPVTGAVLDPSTPNGVGGAYSTPVQVSLFATEPDYPIVATYYSVDGGPLTLYSGPFIISGIGGHYVEAYSVDSFPDEGQLQVVASFTIAIPSPTINEPAAITVDATCPSGAVVNYGAITATDPVDGTIPVTTSPPSGSTFPLGTTTVTCTVIDSEGYTAQGFFTIQVLAPLQISQSVLASLQAIGTLPTRAEQRELQTAITDIEAANDLNLWANPSQPDPFIGLLVYLDWAAAELELYSLEFGAPGTVPTATLTVAIARIDDAAKVAALITLAQH